MSQISTSYAYFLFGLAAEAVLILILAVLDAEVCALLNRKILERVIEQKIEVHRTKLIFPWIKFPKQVFIFRIRL